MSQLISLSRAARIVGTKRSTLQQRIRAGDLHTFEGMLDLGELMRAYPQTQLEDSGEIDRVDRIMEHAVGKIADDAHLLPDARTLAARVTALSHELWVLRQKARSLLDLVGQLRDRMQAGAEAHPEAAGVLRELEQWLAERGADAEDPLDLNEEVYATETLLRLIAARVLVQPSGHEYLVQGRETLLEAGLRAGLALDYGCSNGQCGQCKARVRSGSVKTVRPHLYRLSPEERKAGYTLMCCATAVTDVTLEAAEARGPAQIPTQRLSLPLARVEQLDENLLGLWLRQPDSARLRFLAGQTLTLQCAGHRGVYPIANCPCDDRHIEIHVHRHADQDFATYAFTGLRLSDTLQIEGPHGDFTLDDSSLNPLLLIGWDQGFASVKSLAENAMAMDVADQIHIYWISTQGRSPTLHNKCRAWADALDPVHYHPLDVEPGTRPTSVLADLSAEHFNLRLFDVYVAGPDAVVEAARTDLIARGLPPVQFHGLALD